MYSADPKLMFSNPCQDATVMSAWERFLDGDRPRDGLRPAIDVSWQRCQSSNVDPTRRCGPPPMSDSSLFLLRQAQGELLSASAPVMAHARDFLAETGTMMALANPDGAILSIEGDAATVDDGKLIHLMPGVAWSESLCGTNAIGTALELGQPVQIHSAEHYCEGIKRWTCSATVIRHPLDNEIIGVIDVSGLSRTYSRQALGLVVTTASRIENRLAAREMELRYRLLEQAMAALSQPSRDGLLLIDRRGHVVKANAAAQLVLGQRGGALDLSRPGRLHALSLDALADGPDVQRLPEGVKPEWLQPVMHEGRRIGTLLVLPSIATVPARKAKAEAEPSSTEAVPAFAHLATDSAVMREAVARAAQLARSNVPVLLLGQTGVGKEEFAHGIHRASPHAGGPFVAVNCGGLSRELLASELFGYAEGAFTGARRGGQAGKFEAADGGTLFLDEIGEMPLDLQPHLLRVLEQGEIYRLGESQPRKVDFRLVAATHRELRQEVAQGRFRMDLFYRIAVTSVRIPPLSERSGDVRRLALHFLERGIDRHGLGPCRFSEGVIESLEAYAWPGNVRELRNAVESMLLMSASPLIGLEALPPEIRAAIRHVSPGPDEQRRLRLHDDDAERETIVDAVRRASGNLAEVARLLGIAKSTLYLKLDKHGLREAIVQARGAAQR